MVDFELNVIDREAERQLKKLGDQRLKMERLIMNRIGQGMVANTQTNYLSGQVLKRQSGNLAASIQHRVVSQHAFRIGPGMVYGEAHEKGIPLSAGNIIRAKNTKALRFVINGVPMYRSSVRQHVVKRPYLAPSITEYLSSGKGEQTANKALQDWIDKL